MKLKILDLFSGLGGFSLGLERTGNFETIAFCDNDKYSNLLLQKHWKGVKIYKDVKEITKEKLESDGVELPDIITGGFPCQPFSVAGKQKGTSDDRHLWPEMFRIIQELKPRWVIGENVKGLVNLQDGMVFETVCTDLEGEGYEVRAFNIPAAGVGAPHRRERIWIIAHSDYTGDRASEYETNEDGQKTNEGWQEQSQLKSSRHSENASNSESERLQRSRGQESSGNVNGFQQDKEKIKSEIRGESERRSRTFGYENMENSRRTLQSRTELREKNEDEIKEGYANQHQRSSSTSESNVANAISRDVEAGRERQRGIRKESQGQGTSSDVTSSGETVANAEQSRSSSESIRNIGSLEEESSREKERGNQSSIRTSTRSTDVANTYARLSDGTYKEVQSRRQTFDTSSEGSTDVANTESSDRHDNEAITRDGESSTQEVFGDGDGISGESSWWHVEPDVGRVAHGIPGRVYRLKGLGNSIVPKIAEEIGKAIIEAEREE